ncbi:MAG: hypothetical protein ACLFWL_14040 [Candidatus Brocadiia bacterium]
MRKSVGRISLEIILCLCGIAAIASARRSVAAEPEFNVDGQRLEVKTDRFSVTFDRLAICKITNHLTGETYAKATDGENETGLDGCKGLAIRSLRPAVPRKYYDISEKSEIESKEIPGGKKLIFSGLQHGEVFDPNMTIQLSVQVDPETGDLVIRPEVEAEIEKVFGVRDRGVLRSAIQVRDMDSKLRMILPVSDGVGVDSEDVGEGWGGNWRWPQFWQAALFIAESEKGCMGIWADEPELEFGRHLGLRKREKRWHAAFEFETNRQIYRCTELKGASWRFNVFEGYWANAARRYRQQMEAQWEDLHRLDEGPASWAARSRIVLLGPAYVEKIRKYAEDLPGDSMVWFSTQGWLKGWNDGQIRKRGVGMDYFPNWPLDNPDHYEAAEGMPEKMTALEEMGVHVFPYTNPTIVTHGHPWIRRKIGPRKFFAYRLWQRFYPELCKDLVERYGVSAIYEDCSWVLKRHKLGEPDGENWYQGSVRMRNYFHKLLPDVALMGERTNEVTLRGQKFALTITQWANCAHPILSYLFSPFQHLYNLQLQPGGYDSDDIRGMITPLPTSPDNSPGGRMIRQRAYTFARGQLSSYWPDEWDPKVLHYFRDKEGTEYQFVRDSGTRFLRMTEGGAETIYWRVHGVRNADVENGAVQGWIGYNKRGLVGLNPRQVYIVLPDVKRPSVTISALPEGVFVKRCVPRDNYWLAHLSASKKNKWPQTVTVRVRSSGSDVKFCGVKSARSVGDGLYDVQLEAPGGFGAYWAQPVDVSNGSKIWEIPARNTVHRQASGLVTRYGRKSDGKATMHQGVGNVRNREEGIITYLLKVSALDMEEKTYLVFNYGSRHPYGDGANYKVRINGEEVWKRYRPERGKPDPDQPDKPQPIPLDTGAVNLTPYRGKVIVLELAADGNKTSVSEVVKWHKPVLQHDPPGTAEFDEDVGDPASPDSEFKDGGLFEP